MAFDKEKTEHADAKKLVGEGDDAASGGSRPDGEGEGRDAKGDPASEISKQPAPEADKSHGQDAKGDPASEISKQPAITLPYANNRDWSANRKLGIVGLCHRNSNRKFL